MRTIPKSHPSGTRDRHRRPKTPIQRSSTRCLVDNSSMFSRPRTRDRSSPLKFRVASAPPYIDEALTPRPRGCCISRALPLPYVLLAPVRSGRGERESPQQRYACFIIIVTPRTQFTCWKLSSPLSLHHLLPLYSSNFDRIVNPRNDRFTSRADSRGRGSVCADMRAEHPIHVKPEKVPLLSPGLPSSVYAYAGIGHR